jgi:hypothetical protein
MVLGQKIKDNCPILRQPCKMSAQIEFHVCESRKYIRYMIKAWRINRRKRKWWDSRRKSILFESIIGCKHPTIGSWATPIGSAARAPDRKIRRWKISHAGQRLMIYSKKLWVYTRINIIRLYPRGILPSGALIVYPMINNFRLLWRSKKSTSSSVANTR